MNLLGECPICRSKAVTTFLKRERVPVHQNLVIQGQEAALEISRGSLNLAVCEACGFVFNQSFELAKLGYGEAYDNTQTCSPAFDEYLAQLAQYLIWEKGVQNCRVVEVGCGKGLFLRKLVETEGSGNVGYGFDPSYVGRLLDLAGRLRFEKRYYDSTCTDIPADVIICRHVIEHIPDPLNLLYAIRQALTNSQHARVFFETPCVEWILTNLVVWDFFYEHCSYFATQSLTTAFELSGFKVENVQPVFGGQYLWLEATVALDSHVVAKNSGVIVSLAGQFAVAEAELVRDLKLRIQELAAKEPGKIALWGAGAKGVTFANLVDPERKWIACIVDLNPQKQGHYVPGTGHPIVSYHELARYGVTTAVLMNPNYYAENLSILQAAQLDVRLLDLMN